MVSTSALVACGGGTSPASAIRTLSTCPGPTAGGVGLLAGTVVLGPDGAVASLSPRPVPYYAPAPGDADLPVIPGTTIVVVGVSSALSSNHNVLAPVTGTPTSGGQQSVTFRAVAVGCALLQVGSTERVVAVRSPVSRRAEPGRPARQC
jgi:hypothetical protein